MLNHNQKSTEQAFTRRGREANCLLFLGLDVHISPSLVHIYGLISRLYAVYFPNFGPCFPAGRPRSTGSGLMNANLTGQRSGVFWKILDFKYKKHHCDKRMCREFQ